VVEIPKIENSMIEVNGLPEGGTSIDVKIDIDAITNGNVDTLEPAALPGGREIPVVGQNGKAPTGEKIQEGSEAAVVDAWMFMRLLNRLDQWEPDEFGMGVIPTADSSGFDGGFQTTAMQLTMVVP
jgi:hypothetical protein